MHCISNSELLYNNMATTTTSSFATVTEYSIVTSVPLESESQWSDTKLTQENTRISSLITPSSVTLPKMVSVTHTSKESDFKSVSFLKPTVNLINNDRDSSDPNNYDIFSSTEAVTEALDTNDNSVSSSAGCSSKKSIIRLPIIVLFILIALQYCWYYNDLRVLFIELSDLRWHRRTSFIYNLLYYRNKSYLWT